jgi:hypothetical protein
MLIEDYHGADADGNNATWTMEVGSHSVEDIHTGGTTKGKPSAPAAQNYGLG